MPELNDESLLMLYVADELPQQQRIALEQRMASEPSLRSALETMKDVQMSTDAALEQIDRALPLGEAFTSSVARRTSRAMNQWRIDQLRDAPPQRGPVRLPLGRRAVTAASIAILLGGLLAWWGYEAFNLPPARDQFLEVQKIAGLDAAPEGTEALAQQYASVLGRTPTENEDVTLRDVEQEFEELTAARTQGPLTGLQ